MDEQKVREAIAVLDHEVPRDGARVRLSQYGGGPDEGQIVANRTGYMRLGIEFLKGACPPTGDVSSPERAIDLKYLVTEDSSINFDWFECRETFEQDAASSSSDFTGILFFAVFFTIIALAVIGGVTVVWWFARIRLCDGRKLSARAAHRRRRANALAQRLQSTF